MATITLTDGDFGAEGDVTVGTEHLYLPDRAHPGLTEAVRLADVVEMEVIETDRSGQVQDALKLSARGLMTAGPVGLAAGLLAARKPRDVIFTLTFEDGRKLTAMADAATYANLHAAQVEARAEALREDAPGPADDIIAKYVEALRSDEPVAPNAIDEPRAPQFDPAAAEVPPPVDTGARPVFGKRRRSA